LKWQLISRSIRSFFCIVRIWIFWKSFLGWFFDKSAHSAVRVHNKLANFNKILSKISIFYQNFSCLANKFIIISFSHYFFKIKINSKFRN
jgi:hypothetical protein